jgi:hypothetical protein
MWMVGLPLIRNKRINPVKVKVPEAFENETFPSTSEV